MCRSFSFTSSTMFELMSVLDRHNVDWPEFKEVQRFYSKRAANDATNTESQSPIPSPTNPFNNFDPIDDTQPFAQSPIVQRQLFSVGELFSNTNSGNTSKTSNSSNTSNCSNISSNTNSNSNTNSSSNTITNTSNIPNSSCNTNSSSITSTSKLLLFGWGFDVCMMCVCVLL